MANCPHGFAPGECLICRTLNGDSAGAAPRPGRGRRGTKTAEARPASGLALSPAPTRGLPGTRPPTGQPARVRGGRSLFWPVVAAVVVGGLVVWAFAGVISLAFHIAEYVALALAAGWVGYRGGYARGRRHPRSGEG